MDYEVLMRREIYPRSLIVISRVVTYAYSFLVTMRYISVDFGWNRNFMLSLFRISAQMYINTETKIIYKENYAYVTTLVISLVQEMIKLRSTYISRLQVCSQRINEDVEKTSLHPVMDVEKLSVISYW